MALQQSSLPESDVTAALRAELELELRNKKQCSYQSYECTQLSLNGFKFCGKHILQDKNAPFKQCSYVYSSNGKRCHLPAPRSDKKEYGYCNEHALKATLTRNKQNSKYPPPNTAEVILHSLSHYVKKPRIHTSSSSTQHSDDGDRATPDDGIDLKVTKSKDPFVDLEANSIHNDHCNNILDFCSESESDIEPSTFSSVWHDAQADSSDNESVDSEQEDPLKHANVYTAEEITLITRDKLIRLQSLYIEQYRHLQYLLKEKRRKYLHSLKREKETCCNIYNQVRDNPKEQRLYKKLKALNNYHKYHGTDGILNKRLKDLRAKLTDGTAPKIHSSSKCLFTEGGVKCGEKTLPLAKHCRKHILEDPNQVLFRACGKMNGDVECTTPITATFDDSTCPLHMDIPPLKSYSQLRKDSESDLDDSGDTHLHYPSQFTENIKHEFMNYVPPEIPKMETVPSLLFEESSQSMMSESTISQHEMFGSSMDQSMSQNVSNIKDENENQSADRSQVTDMHNQSGLFSVSDSQNQTMEESGLFPIPESRNQSLEDSSLFPIPESHNQSMDKSGLFPNSNNQTMDKSGISHCPLSANETLQGSDYSQNAESGFHPMNESDIRTTEQFAGETGYCQVAESSYQISEKSDISQVSSNKNIEGSGFRQGTDSDKQSLPQVERSSDETVHDSKFSQLKTELEAYDVEMTDVNITNTDNPVDNLNDVKVAVPEVENMQEEPCNMEIGNDELEHSESTSNKEGGEIIDRNLALGTTKTDNEEGGGKD